MIGHYTTGLHSVVLSAAIIALLLARAAYAIDRRGSVSP